MTKERKTQWHPAFVSAVKLELREDAEYLEYTSEYNLNVKPLAVDLLIVKKEKDIEIKNEIGKIFCRHNLVEYKSPEDALNLNTYLKVVAYACLYKSYEQYMDEIELNEITLTFIREKYPQKLLQWFEMHGYKIEKKYSGIYYVLKEQCFFTQIIVSSQLNKRNQKWLTLLSKELDENDARRMAVQMESLTGNSDRQYGDSILQVAVRENEKIFREIKEEGKMCEALMELMKPEFDAALDKAVNREVNKAVNKAVKNENVRKEREMICQAYKYGNSLQEISKFTGKSPHEIERILHEDAESVKW